MVLRLAWIMWLAMHAPRWLILHQCGGLSHRGEL